MKFWIDFFRDKRFSLDFKIANLIMGDSLRNYLAMDCVALKAIAENSGVSEFYKARLKKIAIDMEVLMDGKKRFSR